MTKIELEILVKILHNTEKMMAMEKDVKAVLDVMVTTNAALIAAIEAFLAKISVGQVVSQADMDAMVAEVQGAIDTAKAETDKLTSIP